MRPPARDLVNAVVYLVALCGILTATTVSYGMLVGTVPSVVRTWTPPETSGTGGPADTRYVSWRLSPEEGQKRFETRSAVLFPPTPAYPEPPNGWASYTTKVNKPASEHVRAWTVLRPARAEAQRDGTGAPAGENGGEARRSGCDQRLSGGRALTLRGARAGRHSFWIPAWSMISLNMSISLTTRAHSSLAPLGRTRKPCL
jgi:hypothetical protein